MSVITKSRLYKVSPRKDSIQAKFADPVNLELVTQLEKYANPIPVKPKNEAVETKPSKQIIFVAKPPEEETIDEDLDDENIQPMEPETEEVEDVEPEEADKSETDGVHSATEITGLPLTENHVTLSNLSTELKATLNSRDDTKGVARVSIKGSECWIYFLDEVNLNDKMHYVIELLNAANYNYLIFNRLARSDNAIVFDINSNDTDRSVQPINDGVKDE